MILLCLNLILQMITVLVMVFHIYALIGLTYFNFDQVNYRPVTTYETSISDFTSYENALIKMLMVVTENGWSNIIYDYAEKFESMINSMMFYHSFYLLVKYIILSLLTGLVWEIFTIINNNLSKKMDSKLEDKADSEASSYIDDAESENEVPDHRVNLEELVSPKDENIVFLRSRLKDTRKDSLKLNEIVLQRDDYSFVKDNDKSQDSFKEINGQE
jgi:hypothetical protein